jgi:hypothetical protein
MHSIKLKKREGADGYFVNDMRRLSILNKALLANEELSVVGVVKERKNLWFIRSEEKDGDDALWVEATFKEVKEFQLTGKKDFLKTEIAE